MNRIATATEINYDLVQRPYVLHHYLGGAADVYWVSQFNPAGQILSTVRTNDAYAWAGHYAVNRPYTTNGLNQYGQAGTTTLGYDANGNLITSGSNYYVYDIENRMVGAPNNIVLSYDPLGRLFQVSNTVSGVATQLLYDGDAMVAEYNGSNVLQRRHVHNVGADVPMATYAVTGGTGLGTISQLFVDRQGSIVAQLTSGGVNTGLNTYDEYGIPGVTNSGRFQYTGQAWLNELGLYYYKARIYSPTLGRFMQTDPIGYDDQFNLYAYVGNDPINNSDPSGEETCTGSHIECDEGGIAPGLSGSSSGARRRQSHIGMNGFPQDGPPPELPVDGETMATMQDSMDMRDVMAQRMIEDRLMERREARAFGPLLVGGPIGLEAGVVARGVMALRASGVAVSDVVRVGRMVVPRAAIRGAARGNGRGVVRIRGIRGGGVIRATGAKMPYHFHIHRYNWYRPWMWFQHTPIVP